MMSAVESNDRNSSDSLKGENERFDIELVYDSFAKCSEDTNALDMNHYLIGFKELYK